MHTSSLFYIFYKYGFLASVWIKNDRKKINWGMTFFKILCSPLFYILFVKIKVPSRFVLGACNKVGQSYTHCARDWHQILEILIVTQCVKIAIPILWILYIFIQILWHTVIKVEITRCHKRFVSHWIHIFNLIKKSYI